MTRYYFDLSYGCSLVVDEEGIELKSWKAAQDEALRALACFVAQAEQDPSNSYLGEMTIQVRDKKGRVVSEVSPAIPTRH
ncbi:DUF6894 family protein [Bradyrhizobium sp. CIR3A]|uniref:DUF6894 family protein n=1 Tax=unclassified Bradyrhizobium TaxID=2631580 RepID=UPI00390CAD34